MHIRPSPLPTNCTQRYNHFCTNIQHQILTSLLWTPCGDEEQNYSTSLRPSNPLRALQYSGQRSVPRQRAYCPCGPLVRNILETNLPLFLYSTCSADIHISIREQIYLYIRDDVFCVIDMVCLSLPTMTLAATL